MAFMKVEPRKWQQVALTERQWTDLKLWLIEAAPQIQGMNLLQILKFAKKKDHADELRRCPVRSLDENAIVQGLKLAGIRWQLGIAEVCDHQVIHVGIATESK